MLNACGQRTIACGNIGKPLSEVAREKQPFDVLTVEVSSFQLEAIRTFRPSISLWLNFAPDHLDRYRSVAEYRSAKLRIFENQTDTDVAVVNAIEKFPAICPRRSPLARTPIKRISSFLMVRLFTKTKPSSVCRTRNYVGCITSRI